MARPPLVAYISVASEAVPALVALVRWRRLPAARTWVVVWCLLLVTMNLIGRWFGVRGINNHFIVYAAIPFQGATILWALSLWQVKPMARLTMRTAIPPFVVAWLLLTLLVEDFSNFSAVAEPVYSLLALGASLYTVLARSTVTQEPLLKQDWFWICAGLAIHFGALATLTPLGAAYVRTNPDLVVRAYIVRAWVNILAFAFITIGMLCPLQSSRSSSPPSSV